MKTTRRLHALLTLALLLALPVTRALALNVSETNVGDFPDSAGAVTATYTYTLGAGSNVFSGQIVAFSADAADFFKVVVPAGLRIAAIQTTGAGAGSFTLPNIPAGPGTYTCGVNPGQIISDVNWTITFTLASPADYDITIAGGIMTVTNSANNADTLSVSEPSAGTIGFARTGRTFSVNGGPNTTNVANVSLSGITSIIINGGSAGEQVNVGAFSGSSFPSLTINGGAGNDTVTSTAISLSLLIKTSR